MKRFVGSVIVSVIGLSSAVAYAEDTDYCERVRARAAGDVAMLVAPSAQLSAIKYPAGGNITAVGGSTNAEGEQIRGALTWSLLNTYKSTFVRDLADADCAQHSAVSDVQNVVEQLNDVGKETALRQQITYFDAASSAIEEAITKANQRLAIGNITIVELNQLNMLVAGLQRKLSQAQGQLEVLHAHRYVKKDKSFAELIDRVKSASIEYEKKQSQIRMFQPWAIDLTGGVVPPMAAGDSVSWFGQVQVSYNFGGLVLGHHEDRYLKARARELDTARYEFADILNRFKDTVRADMGAMRNELSTLNTHLAQLYNTRKQLLTHMDAPNAANAEAMVRLQIIDVESDQELLIGMLTELNQFYGDK